MVVASYTASRRGVLLYLTVIGPVSGLITGLIVLFALGGTRGTVLFVAFLALGVFNTFYFGFRQVYLVELTATELRWRSVLRSGAAPLADLRSIRCVKKSARGGPVNVAIAEFAGRRPQEFLGTRPGLNEFLAAVRETAPQVTVEAPVG